MRFAIILYLHLILQLGILMSPNKQGLTKNPSDLDLKCFEVALDNNFDKSKLFMSTIHNEKIFFFFLDLKNAKTSLITETTSSNIFLTIPTSALVIGELKINLKRTGDITKKKSQQNNKTSLHTALSNKNHIIR